MATLSRVNLRHLSHWSSQWNRLHLPHTYPYILSTSEAIDRAAVREHGNHATQMCPLAHWATIQQTVHVTQRHSYRHQSRHRDSATANDSQPRHGGSNPSGGAQQLWRTVTCDPPSQLISLVLLTGSLELLGFEIRSRQAISIPKRKVLLDSPLRRLAYRALIGEHRDIAISLSPSRQARNGSLLTLSKLHLLSLILEDTTMFCDPI